MTKDEAEIIACGYFLIDAESTLEEQYKRLCAEDGTTMHIIGVYYDDNCAYWDARRLRKEITVIALMLVDAYLEGLTTARKIVEKHAPVVYKSINTESNENG